MERADCPKCGKEMVLRVDVFLRLPGRYTNKISKEVIKKKECIIEGANWPKATLTCWECKYREKGL